MEITYDVMFKEMKSRQNYVGIKDTPWLELHKMHVKTTGSYINITEKCLEKVGCVSLFFFSYLFLNI
jgi:hypothetical protein